MVEATIGRVQIGTVLVGAVAAGLVWALGYPALALPVLGGVIWGMLNVHLLHRISEYLRPDRDKPVMPLLLILTVKFPAMYLVAFLLLRNQPIPVILAAVGGFTVVLLVMLLRGLGASIRSHRRAGTVRGA